MLVDATQWFEPKEWPDKYPVLDERNLLVLLVDRGHAVVHTIHRGQSVKIEDGDWIITETDGVHAYPCKPDIFWKSYEKVVPQRVQDVIDRTLRDQEERKELGLDS